MFEKLKMFTKTISKVLLIVFATIGMILPINAADAGGSITVNMKYKEEDGSKTNLTDGKLEIYELENESGTTSDFINFPGSDESTIVESLESYIENNNISPKEEKTIIAGNAKFEQLEDGRYLIVQSEKSTGYSKISSFLVSLPSSDDNYKGSNVVANPKVEKVETHVLTVKKVVKGNMGSKDKEFKFTIKSTCLAGTTQELSDGTTIGFNSDGEATFVLCGGESIVFPGIQDGTDIQIIEDDYSGDGYITTYEGNEITLNEDAEIIVTNTKTVALPTGNTTQMLVQIFGLGILVVICVTKIIIAKRN